jgi:hypothetical protein
MAVTLGIQYYNSFWLKKKQFDPAGDTTGDWYVEEARIKGGFNNKSVSPGARAFLVAEDKSQKIPSNSIIYSGIYNSRTSVNQTNVFSVAEDITKSVNPDKGSIQKLYAEDTNLIIFQELKVSRALIDKNAIYSAEGSTTVTSSTDVIGQIVPYAGEFGISRNPESFAVYGYRKYFTDRDRGAVLRLSGNGLEEISNFGMKTYFRQQLGFIDDFSRVEGGFDIHNKLYTVSMQRSNGTYQTLAFDDSVNGWVSRFSYKPEFIFSIKNNTFSTTKNGLWIHYYGGNNRGSFYGSSITPSFIEFVFNPEVASQKVFKTIAYEGSNGWEVTSMSGSMQGVQGFNGNPNGNTYIDRAEPILSYLEGSYDLSGNTGVNAQQPIYHVGFDIKENKYVAGVRKNRNPKLNSITNIPGQVVLAPDQHGIKGYYSTVTLTTDGTTNQGGLKELFSVSSDYTRTNGY